MTATGTRPAGSLTSGSCEASRCAWRLGRVTKQTVPMDQVTTVIEKILADLQAELLARGTAFRDSHTTTAETVDAMVKALQDTPGFVKVRWCESPECEQTIRTKTGASPRVIPLEERASGSCAVCGRPAKVWVYYARAY